MPEPAPGHRSSASDFNAAPDARGRSGGRVLIIDDSAAVVRALSTLITRAGFDAIPCYSGGDAISFAQQHEPPAAAVVDVHLPDINGLVLAQKLRTLFGPTTPIIVVSGDTSMETLKSLSHVGAAHFFPKPMNPDALVQRLRELTARGSSDAPS